MKKDITLVILAGGMGSRFGGLKQIEPVGPSGEFIIDYAIYDAVKVGFNKVVFLIKEDNYQVFKDTIGKRIEPYVKVEYSFQKNDNLPDEYAELKARQKPLGTAHAILCCKDKVAEPFAIINADDFYGRDAYLKAYEFLSKEHEEKKHHYGLVGYLVKNTLTDKGAVKRAICEVSDNKLTKLTESSVEKIGSKIIATPLDGSPAFEVSDDSLVSLNMILFDPSIFDYLEKAFPKFLENSQDNISDCEFLIPDVLFDSIEENYATVDVLRTTATWHGVTYREDLPSVKEAIKELVLNKEYNDDLWN